MNPLSLLLVFVGGGLGSVARYMVGFGIARWSGGLPAGTLLANLMATLVLALLWRWAPGDEHTRLIWMTGFCGGFSTFSTFSLDTVQLYIAHGWPFALANVLVNVACCVGIAAWIVLQRTL